MPRFLLSFVVICILSTSIIAAGTVPEYNIGDFRQVIAKAKEAVFPAVVFLMPIAERFDGGKRERTQVAGSGVIISPEGEVVTNWHVVDKAVEIRCLLSDGTSVRASIVGSDKDTDLALLRLENPDNRSYPYANIGDSAHLVEGEFVIAMGAPWGLSRSVSMGILSCVNRFLSDQGGGYNLWLQTDASINPGNSGGPLVDTDGNVIGINSLATMIGGNLAFAVPSDMVKRIVASLRKDGRVIRAWTGIHLQPLRDFEKNIFYEGAEGVLIAGVDPGSPAYEAGVGAGDFLLGVNGREIKGINHEDIPEINQHLADLTIDQPSEFVFRPAGADATRVIAITPTEKGKVEGVDYDCRRWNMTIKTINEFSTPMLHFFRKGGVYIQAVKVPGNAFTAGLESGDIILELDGVPVTDLESCSRIYEQIIADTYREKKVVFTVLRAGLKQYLVLDYSARYGRD